MGTTLRQLLVAVGESLVELRAGALDTPVDGLAIRDPDDDSGTYSGELVLVIGVRGQAAVPHVRAVADRGARAVAVKTAPSGDGELCSAAEEAGIPLLSVPTDVRWDQLSTLIREVLAGAALAAGAGEERGDLFSLAETVSVLTGGSVSIEDAGNRVVAYSRSDDEVDELRRLSILGWQGPEPYLALLREWGVYRRLRSSEDVVHIEQRPELGIRSRLAVGIRAGAQYLGTMWVQQGRRPFAERAEEVLLGAARVAAVHLLRHRVSPGVRSREDLVAGLLEERVSADLVAGHLGLDPAASAIVVAFASRETERDRPAHELNRVELVDVVSVHAGSYRRASLVAAVGSRVYAVLPDVPAGQADPALIALVRHVVDVLWRRTGLRVQAGAGAPVPSLQQAAASRAEADRVLDAMGRTPERDVATIGDLRAEVLLGETLNLLEANPQLRDPAVALLVEHDRAHGSELVPSLLAYLDALGDVRSAANRLHVHPNTLRHRIRRARAVAGIELADPRERLFCHLQLLLSTR
jgi:DNA-binding PucR family transcriptional regulator